MSTSHWMEVQEVPPQDPAGEYDRIVNDLSRAKAEGGEVGIHRYCRAFRKAKGKTLIRRLDALWKLLSPQEQQNREKWSP